MSEATFPRSLPTGLQPPATNHQRLSSAYCLLPSAYCLLAGEAWAHGGEAHGPPHASPDDWWRAWTWNPIILTSLAGLAGLYGLGLRRMWRRAGPGRGVTRGQALAFAAGLLVLFVALISPLDPLSDALSSAHMVQHMLIMVVAAPLVVLGAPAVVMLWALPASWRQTVGRWRWRLETWRSPWYVLWQPVVLWTVFAVTLWVWHLPALYQAALRHPWFHDFQHLTFFVAAGLFWRVLLDPLGRLRLGYGLGALYLFTTSLHATLLGVFMTLAPRVWYPDYEGRTAAWNLSALEDQQLAGLIMWMPACLVYVIVTAIVFAVWLRDPEHPVDDPEAIPPGG